jgi:serine/threonine protein phosphatase PrpC
MGGMPRGDEAAAIAIRAMQSSLRHSSPTETGLREAILNAIDEANRGIGALGVGAGSTLAAIEINGEVIRPYHVGDSMILVVGRRGKIKLYTISHSPVGYAVEAGFLDAEEAMLHEHRHLVSNMLGNSDMRVEMGPPLALARYDTVLLASDGLFDNFHVEEIAERIRKGPLEKVMPQLVHETRQRMQNPAPQHPCKPDDLGVIIYRRK